MVVAAAASAGGKSAGVSSFRFERAVKNFGVATLRGVVRSRRLERRDDGVARAVQRAVQLGGVAAARLREPGLAPAPTAARLRGGA